MTQVSLPVFPSRSNLKLHHLSITPNMVKKVIMNFDLSKTSDPDCIPAMVLKKCKPKLSHIQAELFNKCLKESFFQIGGSFYQWSMYSTMLRKSLQLKTTTLSVFFLRLVRSLKNF